MNLRNTIKLVHSLLEQKQIDHALIGGLALACYGSTRATMDVDLIIHEKDKQSSIDLLKKNGFELYHQNLEVLQFKGIGLVDILLARRPMAEEILKNAQKNSGPEGMSFVQAEDLIGLKIQAYKNDKSRLLQDKADIQFLLSSIEDLDFEKIKKYADLFGEWESILEIKNSH
jgi:hypothetical protein